MASIAYRNEQLGDSKPIEIQTTDDDLTLGMAAESLRYMCHRCPETFEGRAALATHLSSAHQSHRSVEKLERQDRGSPVVRGQGSAVDKLTNDPHRDLEDARGRDRPKSGPSCKLCLENFESQSKLIAHLWFEHNMKSYACGICSNLFHQQQELAQHLRVAHRRNMISQTTTDVPDTTVPKIMTDDDDDQFAECSSQAVIDLIDSLQRDIRARIEALSGDGPLRRTHPEKTGSSSSSALQDNPEASIHPSEVKIIPDLEKSSIKISSIRGRTRHKDKAMKSPASRQKPGSMKSKMKQPESYDESFENPYIPALNVSFLSSGFSLETTNVLEILGKLMGPVRLQGFKSPSIRKQYLCERIKLAARVQCKSSCHKCGDKFTTLGSILDHMWLTHGEKHYPCETCKKSYGLRKMLFEHISYKHCSESRFSCNTCSQSFDKKSLLKQHLNAKHW